MIFDFFFHKPFILFPFLFSFLFLFWALMHTAAARLLACPTADRQALRVALGKEASETDLSAFCPLADAARKEQMLRRRFVFKIFTDLIMVVRHLRSRARERAREDTRALFVLFAFLLLLLWGGIVALFCCFFTLPFFVCGQFFDFFFQQQKCNHATKSLFFFISLLSLSLSLSLSPPPPTPPPPPPPPGADFLVVAFQNPLFCVRFFLLFPRFFFSRGALQPDLLSAQTVEAAALKSLEAGDASSTSGFPAPRLIGTLFVRGLCAERVSHDEARVQPVRLPLPEPSTGEPATITTAASGWPGVPGVLPVCPFVLFEYGYMTFVSAFF